MEIKEQIKEVISKKSQIYHTNFSFHNEGKDIESIRLCEHYISYLTDRLYDCVSIWLEQAGYLPLQAGGDGLISEAEKERIHNESCSVWSDDSNWSDGHPIKTLQSIIDGKLLQAQKALTESQAKQKQAEAVKKVFDWIKKCKVELNDKQYAINALYVISPLELEAFKKQTLKEQEKGE